MEEKLPLQRLSRLTWLQAIIIGFIFYLVASNSEKPDPHTVVYTVLTMSGVLLVGYSDIVLMIIIAKKNPTSSKKFSLLRLLLTYPVSILIYLLLRPCFSYISGKAWSFWDSGSFFAFVGSGIVINSLITVLHNSVLLYQRKLYNELELSKLKAANAEAMNLVLKQQIQPHFLFNALNTLKALYHKDHSIADTYIVHMADFLRASISHHTANVSILEDEIKLLRDYLAMQQIRFGVALDCTINLTDEVLKSYFLPSFSLQPLLENAIKHNNFTPEDPLHFSIYQLNDRLVISNNIQKKKIRVESTNSGLANLAERYRLCSGDDIIIAEDQNSFSVSIKLLSYEHSNY